MFLLAAALGVAATWFFLRRYKVVPIERVDDPHARFARETLVRLQDLTHRVAADVDQHTSCVQEINAQLADPENNDETSVLAAVAQLIEANQRMQEQLDTAEERIKAQARQIESHAVEARTDALTQVANRRALDDELRRAVQEYERRGIPVSIMLVDVDHFKKFNDTHGHQAGDEVLRGVARVLRNNLGELGLVSRYGGEEFGVVFAGHSLRSIVGAAERARQAIAGASFRFGGRELRVTASAGLAEIQFGQGEKDLIKRADEALYAGKAAGRNCGHYNDGTSNHKIAPETIAAAPHPASDRLGDEWLYDADFGSDQPQPMVHVADRPAFFDGLIRRLSQCRRDGTPLSLVLVQVDGYSRIVGDHGSTAAEVVLRVGAQLINAAMRDIDQLARLGDDTFALLMPGAQLENALSIAERLRQAVERCRLPRRAGTSWFTISVGIVEATNEDDLRRVLERARKALHAAVNGGRNRTCAHDALGCTVKEMVVVNSAT
jgi:diguanylate cyclase